MTTNKQYPYKTFEVVEVGRQIHVTATTHHDQKRSDSISIRTTRKELYAMNNVIVSFLAKRT